MKELAYKIIDLLTMGKGLAKTFHGHRVKLPTRYINYFPSDYETDNFRFLEEQDLRSGVVLDIGAHIGLFSVIAAQLTGEKGRVFAFEPSPATSALLRKTIAINQMESRIEAVPAAMSKEVGTITFFISDNQADNSNSLVSYKNDRKLNGIDVMMDTIDHFTASRNIERISFIKIDVEGAEYDALQGGREVFSKHRPACILAIHPEPIRVKGDRLEDIYDFLVEMRYRISFDGKPMDRESFCSNTELIDLKLLPL